MHRGLSQHNKFKMMRVALLESPESALRHTNNHLSGDLCATTLQLEISRALEPESSTKQDMLTMRLQGDRCAGVRAVVATGDEGVSCIVYPPTDRIISQ
jgi:hypothetical protein